MIYTPNEYSKIFKFGNKKVSARTIKRRCAKNMLPKGHVPRKLPGKRGMWIIEVRDYYIIDSIIDPSNVISCEPVMIKENREFPKNNK